MKAVNRTTASNRRSPGKTAANILKRSLPAAIPPSLSSSQTTRSVPVTRTTQHGSMYIQLGAFSSSVNANRLKSELATDYPSVAIYAKNGGYAEVYRVRIGPFHDEKLIESQVLALQEQGYTNAIVVIE